MQNTEREETLIAEAEEALILNSKQDSRFW